MPPSSHVTHINHQESARPLKGRTAEMAMHHMLPQIGRIIYSAMLNTAESCAHPLESRQALLINNRHRDLHPHSQTPPPLLFGTQERVYSSLWSTKTKYMAVYELRKEHYGSTPYSEYHRASPIRCDNLLSCVTPDPMYSTAPPISTPSPTKPCGHVYRRSYSGQARTFATALDYIQIKGECWYYNLDIT
jgi:hypothetical protein